MGFSVETEKDIGLGHRYDVVWVREDSKIVFEILVKGNIYKDLEVLSRVNEMGYRGLLVAPSRVLASNRELIRRFGVKTISAEKLDMIRRELFSSDMLKEALAILVGDLSVVLNEF